MVTKRIRSEYMKKFKDPKWETYTKCYEEMLKYRLTRRLLEHTHNPWFWSGPDSDSDSGGPSPPPPCKNRWENRCETSRERSEAELEECQGSRSDGQQASVPRLPLPLQDEDNVLSGSHLEAARETGGAEEERQEAPYSQDRGRDTEGLRPQQSKAPKPSKPIWGSQRVRPEPTRQPRDGSKERRHPFALYASGEKDADMASRKTHNVGPEASTKEIHESALRAKVRREVGRQIQTQRTERRRAKSAHLDKTKKLVQPEFNPWVTEYMRCFSARSR